MPETGTSTTEGGLNPFAHSERPSSQALIIQRIANHIAYVVLLVTATYYLFKAPSEGQYPRHTIWGNNVPTPFAQNSAITTIYWTVLFLLQFVYNLALYSSNSDYVSSAISLTAHHISSTLLLFAFIHLWVRSHFWLALLILIVNFVNLSTAYFRQARKRLPILLHAAVLSGPLAWNFVALYWAGARAVNSDRLIARIVGNVFIWGIAAYGAFFLAAFKDWSMGFALSVLAFSTAVGQFLTKLPILQLQWIFAFTIGGLLFVTSAAVAFPEILGRDPVPRGEIVDEERERRPLLAEE